MNTSQFLNTDIEIDDSLLLYLSFIGWIIHVELIYYSTETVYYNLDSKFYYGNKG